MTGPVEAATSNAKGAFLKALDSEFMGAEKDMRDVISRQTLQGFYTVQTASNTVGRTGAVALLAAGTGDADLVLDAATTRAQVRFLEIGMIVDVITTTTGAVLASERTITAIDKSNPAAVVVSVSGANITRVAGDQIVLSGSYDAESAGLPALINDNDGDQVNGSDTVLVHNVSSATVPRWASPVIGDASTPITEALLDEAFDHNSTDGNGALDDGSALVVGSYEQRRTLATQMVTQRRMTVPEAVTPKAGTKGIELARGGVFVADKYALDNDLFFIAPEDLVWAVLLDFGLEDRDGQTLRYEGVGADGIDAFGGVVRGYAELVAANRNSHVRVKVQPV